MRQAEARPEKAKHPTASPRNRTDETVASRGSLILSVTEGGYGKRTPADEYRLQGRGGSGVINVKTTERNGKVVGIAQVTEESEVMLISHYGKIIRMDFEAPSANPAAPRRASACCIWSQATAWPPPWSSRRMRAGQREWGDADSVGSFRKSPPCHTKRDEDGATGVRSQ